MSRKDLAFPLVSSDIQNVYDSGMELRDWFAGQALASLDDSKFSSVEGTAHRAYEIADAMMEARKK